MMNKVLMCAVQLFDIQQEIILVNHDVSEIKTVSCPFTEDLPEAIVEICDETQVYEFYLNAPKAYADHIIEVVYNMNPKINIHYLQGEK